MSELFTAPSPIGGTGVFTREPLVAGQRVKTFVLQREVTEAAPPRRERGEQLEHCTWIEGRTFLVAGPERYLNHSCAPNLWLRFGERVDVDPIEMVALRDIAAGSELTLDYLVNNPGGDSWPCGCGAARCRGETGVSFFTLPEAFQREYAPQLAPWFRRRFRRELAEMERSWRGGG